MHALVSRHAHVFLYYSEGNVPLKLVTVINPSALKMAEPSDRPWLTRLVQDERIYSTLAPEMAEATESTIGNFISAADPGTTTKVFIIIRDAVYIGFITLSNIQKINFEFIVIICL